MCLAWALERFRRVETIAFDYHQRHRVELDVRVGFLEVLRRQFPDWADRLGNDHVLELPTLAVIGDSALTNDVAIEMTDAGLPNTFVPGRNLLFFTFAAAVAYRRGLGTLVGGMCETDYSGYPDCRNDTLQTLGRALSLGLAKPTTIATPLMWIDKQATWSLAEDLGGQTFVDLILEHTHTCYLGDRSQRHAWGYGCGGCPACELRATGWTRWRAIKTN